MSTTTPVSTKPIPKSNPNALLLFWRKAHMWLGLIASLFLLVIAVTGIYLNHKNTLGGLLGIKKPEKGDDEKTKPVPNLAGGSASELANLPVSFAEALSTANGLLGDAVIDRVELKPEKGRWVYKVKARTGVEAVIDSATGRAQLKGELLSYSSKPADTRESAPTETSSIDWGKAIKDLHTGKIGGDAGKLLVDLVAGTLIVLTLSGIYLWVVPTLRRRRSYRQAAAAKARSSTNG
jgi:hypothetical protein